MTNKEIDICRISFPDIKLGKSAGHKLRGYFGNLFRERSTLLHNHYENGRLRYKYPSVQYKILDGVPRLIGIDEGARLLPSLFLDLHELRIDGRQYLIDAKNIELKRETAGITCELKKYRFANYWMALNQENHTKYLNLESSEKKTRMLNSILINNILSFFKNTDIILKSNERIMVNVDVSEGSTKFKDNRMIVFSGSFVCNTLLPDGIGLGKSVSRGFGAIKRQ